MLVRDDSNEHGAGHGRKRKETHHSPFWPSPKLTSVAPAGRLLRLSSWLGSWLFDMVDIMI